MEKEIKMPKIDEIAAKYGLSLVVLFGSRAKGKADKESDYDMGYLAEKILSIKEEGELMIDLAKTLKIPLEKIELICLRNASPLFLKEVFENAVIIFAKDSIIFDEYQILSRRYFEESQPIFDQRAVVIKKRVEEYKKELSIK